MKTCPMCRMALSSELSVCSFCEYDLEKPLSELSKSEIDDLMSPYEYCEADDGGYRILTVKNIRDTSLRGSVSLPPFITEIAAGAFANCKFLSAISLPSGLKSIGENAFGGCRDLFDVFIPRTVLHMGKAVFADCYSLGNIRCGIEKLPSEWDAGWLDFCDAEIEWDSFE